MLNVHAQDRFFLQNHCVCTLYVHVLIFTHSCKLAFYISGNIIMHVWLILIEKNIFLESNKTFFNETIDKMLE